MSTKTHWRQAALLPGLAADPKRAAPDLMHMPSGRHRRRKARRFLDRLTRSMLAKGWRPGKRYGVVR
ncbi:MAG TPA: hypothetical protein PLL78_09365 [Fimbriimonadaceae bacterium]|nr:hypothetical protein [Fimbriimonadaceae bacterium]